MPLTDNQPEDAYAVCDAYMESRARLVPVMATFWGVPGHDDRWSDLSPAGWDQARQFAVDTLAAAAAVAPGDRRERVALDVLQERVRVELDMIDAGEAQLGLSTLNGHHTSLRDIFDFMPQDDPESVDAIRKRLATIGDALAGHRETFAALARQGIVGLRSQATVSGEQCLSWGEPGSAFSAIADAAYDDAMRDAAASAMAAFREHGRWLRDEYAPIASQHVGVGSERYSLYVRSACGVDLDLEETYEWGWDELRRISDRIDRLLQELTPGRTRRECMDILDRDPRYCVPDADSFVRWSQDTIAGAFEALDGSMFDIPEQLRRCETMRIPADLAGDSYYTAPTEDFSRPGMVWHPIEGQERFPLWPALSTLYHEGVPGHHLQLGQVMYLADRLTRFQRLDVYIPAHGEGWALYAERLMHELGYLDDPGFELGWLMNQSLRAARVVVDIGLHCAMRIPPDERFRPGALWDEDVAAEFLKHHTAYDDAMVRSEIRRYIGMPAQAISYKVGERVWLAGRNRVRQRLGATFDLRAFHTHALDLGPMGLDLLAHEFEMFGE